MNAKTLYTLIAAALVALLAAVWINSARAPISEQAEHTQSLLPGLRDHVNDIDSVTFTGAGAQTLATFKRSSGGWSIVEKSNYSADIAKLREFLLKLAGAVVVEAKTSNPKLYADLGVNDISDKDAKGVLVTLDGLKPPIRLIVGNFNGASGGGTFVRKDGEAQSQLANGNLTVDKALANWEKRDLVDIAASRLKQIVLTQPDGKALRAYKEQASDSNFKVADVPKGRELSAEYAANVLGSLLPSLRADDVEAAKDAPPGEQVYKGNYAAFDGLVIDVSAWEKDGKDYAQFAAKLDATQADVQIKADQDKATADYALASSAAKPPIDGKTPASAPAVSEIAKPLALTDPVKDREQRLAAINEEIASLNKTFNGWTFVLPNFKFVSINKTMNDMLKPLDAPKTDAKGGKPAAKPQVPDFGIKLPPPAAKPADK